MKRKFCVIDFEFYGTSDEELQLVCCSYRTSDLRFVGDIWLHYSAVGQDRLADTLEEIRDNNYVFLAHNVVAEARSIYSLGLDPTGFKWIDTFAEWRCLTNHNHNYQ